MTKLVAPGPEVGKKDKARLIESLKTLGSVDAQDAVFTDEVIRYLAVHDFMQNSDSYTGTMVHNYYLYEEDGRFMAVVMVQLAPGQENEVLIPVGEARTVRVFAVSGNGACPLTDAAGVAVE